MTFYLFNLAITCYVIPDVIRYCMVFSDEDKIQIKKLYQLKVYNARQLSTEVPDIGRTKSSISS